MRRFPERPPTFPPPPMAKVLELVHEWKNTICLTSKHKEDLVHIRDMHRLLSYKGERALEVRFNSKFRELTNNVGLIPRVQDIAFPTLTGDKRPC